MRNTPEFTHFSRAIRFTWVLFAPPGNDEFPEFTDALRVKLATRYRVFDKTNPLPKDYEVESEMRKAFRDGFLFTVEVKRSSPNTVAVTFEDYEGALAAGSKTNIYRWNGRRWRLKEKGDQIVS